MKAIIKIAWRNVWRNKLRSTIVISSLVLGIWSGLSIMSFTYGMNEQRLRSAIDTYLSHVQIHDSTFLEDQGIKYSIEGKDEIIEHLDQSNVVKAWTARNIISGTANTAHGSYPTQLKGIIPDNEKKVTTIANNLVEGTFFTKYKKNPILVGEKLADKLQLKIKSSLIINFQDVEGNIVHTKFKVEGIYKTGNSMNDLLTIYARQSDIDREAKLNGAIHEISIIGTNIETSDSLKTIASTVAGDNSVQTWAEVSPELGYAQELMGSYIYIFMGIILLALAFGIINTMLMAVLERKRELGMLLAVGMNRSKVFYMFVFETLFISLVATPIGMLLSYMTISHLSKTGINLSAVGEGLENYGMSAILYPSLDSKYYFTITLMTIIVAYLASLIPARRAMKTVPAEAVKAI